MANMQQTTSRYGAKIVTVDPTQGLIEAVTKDGSIRRISVYSLPNNFEWPVVGDNWMIMQMNGSWYLEGRFPNQKTYQTAEPGDSVIITPTGVVRVITDGASFDYVLMEPGRVILQAGDAPVGFLPCNGQVVKASDYPNLAQILSPNIDTFTLPVLMSPAAGVNYYIKC